MQSVSEQDQESEEAPVIRQGFNVFLDKTHSVSSVHPDEEEEQENQDHDMESLKASEESEEESVHEVLKPQPKSTGKQSRTKKEMEPLPEPKAFQTFERPFSVTKSEKKSVAKESVRKSVAKVEVKTPKSVAKTPKSAAKQSARRSQTPAQEFLVSFFFF